MGLKLLKGRNAFRCHRCATAVPWNKEGIVAGDTDSGDFFCPNCTKIVLGDEVEPAPLAKAAPATKPKPTAKPGPSMAAAAGAELAGHDPSANHTSATSWSLSAKVGLPGYHSISASVTIPRVDGEAEEEFRARCRRALKIGLNETAVAFREAREAVIREAIR